MTDNAPDSTACCTRCHQVFPVSNFYVVWIKRDNNYRRRPYCKECGRKQSRDWSGKQPKEKRNAKNRKYLSNNPEKNYHYGRKARLRRNYGITLSDYDAMAKAQKGKCAICRKIETARKMKQECHDILSVDHCHETGKVRALLCRRCNAILGLANDDIALLKKAARYISRHKKAVTL